MEDNSLSQEQIDRIGKVASAVVDGAMGDSLVPPPVSRQEIMSAMPSPSHDVIDSINNLMKMDDRILRACLIFESESPLNVDRIKTAEGKQEDLLLSFVLMIDGQLNFVNFGLDVDDNLSSKGRWLDTISTIALNLRVFIDNKTSAQSTEATGGEG